MDYEARHSINNTNACSSKELEKLEELARWVRRRTLKTLYHSGVGHAAADMSATDILTVLYGAVLNVDAHIPDEPDRDRMIVSKSHCSGALYSILSNKGFIELDELNTFGCANSRLCTAVSHRTPGVEFSTGALGHGLPMAVGCAIGARMDQSDRRTFVMTGDGELQEGSNWEALMLAATLKLDRLTLVVDRNRVQKGASTEEINALEPLEDKFLSFGWAVRSVDGHSVSDLLTAFRNLPMESGKPSCIIAQTIKGKGVSFMENHLEWHGKKLGKSDLDAALKELVSA